MNKSGKIRLQISKELLSRKDPNRVIFRFNRCKGDIATDDLIKLMAVTLEVFASYRGGNYERFLELLCDEINLRS